MAGLCLAAALLAASDAATLYKEGRRAEQAGEFARAYLLYAQAAAADPANRVYWARSQALRRRAILESPPRLPQAAPEEAAEDSSLLGTVTEVELAEARRPLPPAELKAQTGRQSFDLRAEPRSLFEQIGKAFGLECVFDGDYPAAPPIRFRINDVDYREALAAVEAATASVLFPLSDRLFLVAKDTPQKRQDLEPNAALVIPIPNPVAVQDAVELARGVQQVLEIKRLLVDQHRRIVLLRDRVSRVRQAAELFQQLLRHRPQVMLEVDFLTFNETSSLSYGFRLQTSYAVVNFGSADKLRFPLRAIPSIPAGFARFLVFGGGMTFLGLGLTDAELFAEMSRGHSRNAFRTQLRALDGQPASFHIGDKYPVITSGYYGPIEGSGQVYRPPPVFNFEDLGLVLKITPRIHGNREITLEVEAEFKVLTGQTLNDIPVIANRKFQSSIRLREGQWAVMAGLLSASETRTLRGLAGLARLPLLGPLVSETTRDKVRDQSLLIIKPTIVDLPPSEYPVMSFWSGSETRSPADY